MLYVKPKAKPTNIMLLSDWMGTAAGTKITVWSDVATHLVSRGVAEYFVGEIVTPVQVTNPIPVTKPERKKREFKRIK